MPAPDVALRHYRAQRQLAARAATAAQHLWRGMSLADLDKSWETVGPRLQALLTLAQARAAVDGAAYVPEVLAEQGIADQPEGDVNADRLAGVASSGGDIGQLLYGPVIQTKMQIAEGIAAQIALDAAQKLLTGIMLTQVADAGRVATGTATVARPNLPGYVRRLTRPSCSRCVILAGKTFHWNQGFLRHPRCDCVHIPVAEDTFDDLTTDPLGYFKSLTWDEQIATFGQAGAAAIRDGANIGQVVNARKGMYTASEYGRKVSATTQGTTKRALAGKRLQESGADFAKARGERYARSQSLRLMPEQIYKDAGSRADAIRLLRHFGYIT